MISVIGTGTMGKGIAIELAANGNFIQLITITRDSCINLIKEELKSIIDKFEYQNKNQILENICISDELKIIGNSELVIEAVVENLEIKRNLLIEMKEFLNCETIIASNTSSLSISEIFNNIFDFDRVIGLHFFNPVQVMKLVEIAYTNGTSQKTIDYAKRIVNCLGKEYVVVKDSPGFIVNRLLIPMINEAAKIIDEEVATAQDIDKAMKLGANHPIGPLKLSDLIGNDITLSIVQNLYKIIQNNNISNSLSKLVNENKLGRKTKTGFYEYNN